MLTLVTETLPSGVEHEFTMVEEVMSMVGSTILLMTVTSVVPAHPVALEIACTVYIPASKLVAVAGPLVTSLAGSVFCPLKMWKV